MQGQTYSETSFKEDLETTNHMNFKEMNDYTASSSSTSTFIARSSSLPIVNDAISYISSSYLSLKGKNGYLDGLLARMENTVSKTTNATVDFSKKLLNTEYLDTLACKGLDTIETYIPNIKKPTKEIVQDSREFTLEKLSGISPTEETPKTLKEALDARRKNLEMQLSKRIWNSYAGKTVAEATKGTLDISENIVDLLFPPKKNNPSEEQNGVLTEDFRGRLYGIGVKTRRRFLTLAKELRKDDAANKSHHPITPSDVASVTNYWLSNLYKTLQEKETDEGLIKTVLRYSALTGLGATLAVNGAIAATLPRVENVAFSSVDRLKEVTKTVAAPLKAPAELVANAVRATTDTTKQIFVGLAKNVQDLTRRTYEGVTQRVRILSYGIYRRGQKQLPLIIHTVTTNGTDFVEKLNKYINEYWNTNFKKTTEDGLSLIQTPNLVGTLLKRN